MVVHIIHTFYLLSHRGRGFDADKRAGKGVFVALNLTPEDEVMDMMWQLGGGNPLWNRICAMKLRTATSNRNTSLMPGSKAERTELIEVEIAAIKLAQASIWKYLNRHVYDQWDSELREALMKLSIIGTFDLDIAVYITGNNRINVLLQQAMELGNFLVFNEGTWSI